MKKLFIFAILSFSITLSVFAEQQGVFLEFHRKNNPENNTKVNRSPMRLPIDVLYDTETHIIKIIGDTSLEVEVFLYNNLGEVVDFSTSLDAEFSISSLGTHTIYIQGDNWYAQGNIEVN